MAEKKVKHAVLSLQQKIELIQCIEAGERKKKDVARDFNVCATTVSHILRQKDKLRKLYNGGEVDARNLRRHRAAVHDDVEAALLQWFKGARSYCIPITGPILAQKAYEFARELGKPQWICTSGWLWRFKKRYGIVRRVVSGERHDVDQKTTDAWIEGVLLPTLQRFKSRDIFSADECGLYWRLLPDRTLAFRNEKCRGGKKSKERLTVMLCCNMQGDEKRVPMVIGKFSNPRCFRGIKTLPVDHENDERAWMTSGLFAKWVRGFDRDMDSQNRRVLLVLDSCSAHVPVEGLKATEMLFLPPNAAAKVQTLDRGIIKSFKYYYRTMLITRLAHHADSGSPLEDFQVTLLDALTLVKSAWEKVTPLTVQQSFRLSGFALPGPKEEPSETEGAIVTEPAVMDALLSRLYGDWSMSADDFTDFDNDVATCAALSTEDIQSLSVPASDCAPPDADSDDGDRGDQDPPVSTIEALAAVSKLELYLMQAGCSDDLSSRFRNFREPFEHFVHMRTPFQTKMTPFFPAADMSRKHTTAISPKPSATQTSASSTELTTHFFTHRESPSSPSTFTGPPSASTRHPAPPSTNMGDPSISSGPICFPSTGIGPPLPPSACTRPFSSPFPSRGPASSHPPCTRPSSTITGHLNPSPAGPV